MASDFSTAGSLPPRFIAAPFTNPFEERDGIAWRNELLAFTGLIQHGQWGEVGRLRSKLRHPYSSGRSVAAPSATSIRRIARNYARERRSNPGSVNR